VAEIVEILQASLLSIFLPVFRKVLHSFTRNLTRKHVWGSGCLAQRDDSSLPDFDSLIEGY